MTQKVLNMKPNMNSSVSYKELANAIRFLSIDAVEKCKSGHPGMPMGMADIATVLFSKYMKFNPKDPNWPDRDRFILSNGHGSMLLYSLLYLTGYQGMTLEQLKNFRQLGSHTAGHPEADHDLGIETTTGPLGQGFGNAVGMALAERLMNAHFGDDLVNHFTYVFVGDGCLMEGISHEVASFAGHLKLNKLIVFYDDNSITIDGSTDLSCSDDATKRFEAYGWTVLSCDGHNVEQIESAIEKARGASVPVLIRCKTQIGFGSPKKSGTAGVHGSPLGMEEVAATREALGWPHEPFVIPEDILSNWHEIGRRSESVYNQWHKNLNETAASKKEEFTRRLAGDLPNAYKAGIEELKKVFSAERPDMATRKTSEKVLGALTEIIPELIGGSADLTGSNNTKTPSTKSIQATSYDGRYVYYGIREHGMASIMNGLSLYGGFIPYGGTFLVFTDYCRPSIRLSALMKQRVVYVMTHDSIGLGEDGPTHQPIEHLSSLRAIPNLKVFRPADGVETAECWQLALENKSGPSVLALTRQDLPTVRKHYKSENLCERGVYLLQEELGESADKSVRLFATGSEVSLALKVQKELLSHNVSSQVYSVPCQELIGETESAVFKSDKLNVAIEAAHPMSWYKWIGKEGLIFGIDHFGASAPYQDVYNHVGLESSKITKKIMTKLQDEI